QAGCVDIGSRVTQIMTAFLVVESWVLFFFSSRRRHTRLVSDWSSDVCSSDLGPSVRRPVGIPGLPPDVRRLEQREASAGGADRRALHPAAAEGWRRPEAGILPLGAARGGGTTQSVRLGAWTGGRDAPSAPVGPSRL